MGSMLRLRDGARTEFRIVCANENHRSHAWLVGSVEQGKEILSEERRIKQLHKHQLDVFESCEPYRIETRDVGKWTAT